MNTTLQSTLSTLESSLDALVDSITTYNPSPSAAHALLTADDALTSALDTLSTHQRNAHALTQLRAASARLDDRIKSTLSELAATRATLRAQAPPEKYAPAREPVDYKLLLSTAQRIAPFTRPPAKASVPQSEQMQAQSQSEQAREQAEGMADPSQGTASTDFATMTTTAHSSQQQQQPGDAVDAVLDPQHRAWLDPRVAATAGFVPWPDERALWAGALGRLHGEGLAGVTGDATSAADRKLEQDDDKALVNGAVQSESAAARPARAQLTGEEIERRRAEAEARRKQQEEELEGFELYNPDDD